MSLSRDAMVAVRNQVRDELVRRVHALRMLARCHRKIGNLKQAQVYDAEARKTEQMVKLLDDPMEALTFKRDDRDGA